MSRLKLTRSKKGWQAICKACGHKWLYVLPAPMELVAFGQMLKGSYCPKCGAGSDQLALRDRKPSGVC